MSIGTCKSYLEGLVSGTFPDPEDPTVTLCMTSPNMVALPYPVVHEQASMRMYADGRFGHGDYILHPQPFHLAHGHLALCLAPDLSVPNSARAILHQTLTIWDWHPNMSVHPGYGVIIKSRVNRLSAESEALMSRFQLLSDRAELADMEEFATTYKLQRPFLFKLRHFLGRLSTPATFPECVRIWATVQRIYIELSAWLDYMETFRPLFHDPPIVPRSVDLNRIGAITFSHIFADKLFRIGVPTYFVRRVEEVDLKKIGVRLAESEMKKLLDGRAIVRVGHQAGNAGVEPLFEPKHADPPHPIIFHGPPTSINRLLAMYAWFRQDHPLQRPSEEWQPSDVAMLEQFGVRHPQHSMSSEPATSATVSSAPPTAPPISPRASSPPMPIPTASAVESPPASSQQMGPSNARRPQGQRGGRKKTKGSAPPRRDKWTYTSDYMPEPIDTWQAVAAEKGRGHSDTSPSKWPGATEGWKNYGVPEPGMMANLAEAQRRHALLNWCRFRCVVSNQLEASTQGLKASSWRSIMTFDGSTTSKSETFTAKRRMEAIAALNQAIRAMGIDGQVGVDEQPAEVYWRDIRLDNITLTRPIIQSITADINEMGFRWELCNLDGVLFDRERSAPERSINGVFTPLPTSTPSERRWEVLGRISHFGGSYTPEEDTFYFKPRGFAASNMEDRARAVSELAEIMDDWVPKYRMEPDALGQLQALARDNPFLQATKPAFDMCERKVVEKYVTAFKDVYDRAPILPRSTHFPL